MWRMDGKAGNAGKRYPGDSKVIQGDLDQGGSFRDILSEGV